MLLNAGLQIAQRGSLIVVDELVASLPAGTRDLFFPQHHGAHYYGVRFMGFFLVDPAVGTVVDQFPHLYPAAVAIGKRRGRTHRSALHLDGVRRLRDPGALFSRSAAYWQACRRGRGLSADAPFGAGMARQDSQLRSARAGPDPGGPVGPGACPPGRRRIFRAGCRSTARPSAIRTLRRRAGRRARAGRTGSSLGRRRAGARRIRGDAHCSPRSSRFTCLRGLRRTPRSRGCGRRSTGYP